MSVRVTESMTFERVGGDWLVLDDHTAQVHRITGPAVAVVDAVVASCGLEGVSPFRLGRPHPGENSGFSREKAA